MMRPPREEANMAEKTEAQKKAQRKYMEKFVVAKARMDPEKYEIVKAHAEARDGSVNGFINRAIDETMERDKKPPVGPGEPTEGSSHE